MLRESLIAEVRPCANEKNILFWQDYRVSVLGGRLFRLEKSKTEKFRDDATQAVWFRDMPPQYFTVEMTEKNAIIDTGECKLILAKTRGQVRVEFNGKQIPADNTGNLLGTYRTLDNCNGDVYFRPWIKGDKRKKIRLDVGVCSTTGVAVLDDSRSLTLGRDGQVHNQTADGSDEYIFAFGQDYLGALRALYALTGSTPLVPRFALGNWWSRYHVYTDEDYLRLLQEFSKRGIPLSVATVDMDWHYSERVDEQKGISAQGKNTPEYVGTPQVNCGWTGYSWNTELFPAPREFLEKVKKTGLKVTLNLHPSDGVRFWEDGYEKMANAVGRDALTQKQIPFDFTWDTFIHAYFDVLHRPLEEDGVDFWWIDWQQEKIAWHGQTEKEYDPLWALNHYHYLHSASQGKTPLILSRYAGVGSHRYPLGFSGDTEITWKTLAYLPYFTATASNIGYTWWSHDIGGHNFGEKNDELYVRHLQYGVFSPITRLHSTCDETMTKEPWAYGNGTGLIAAEFLRFRHALVPYLYTASRRVLERGEPLVQPVYYREKTPLAYRYLQTYFFGSELFVAPVTQKRRADGYARTQAWLPEGRWTDIFTGDVYEIEKGGREVTFLRELDSIPVLAKSGGILPLSKDKGNGCANPETLEIRVYLGNGEYTLYEDGKEQGRDGTLETQFYAEYTQKDGACTQALTIVSLGDRTVVPENRRVFVRFVGVPAALVRLHVDGKERACSSRIADSAGAELCLEVGKTYRLTAEFAECSETERLVARAKDVLTRAQGNNVEKLALWKRLKKVKTRAEYVRAVENSKVLEIAKLRLKETL